MNEKIMFVPKTERYTPNDMILYLTRFHLGFFDISFRIIRSEMSGISRIAFSMLQKTHPNLARKFINIMTIGQLGWIWLTSDQLEEAEVSYKDVIRRLKYGDDVEFIDIGEQSTPVRISWRGIQFQW